ncbi:MAG: MarR family transcriptional regulator [Veillonellaceae bacterium]|nr:MarR family transcriptional regulator [Veillonellaceae bacterium]
MDRHSAQDNRQAMRLYIALTRTYKAVLERDQRNIRGYGLNASEFGVLELLYNKGPLPLQQIGGKILITSGTITYVIDKLTKKGLLIRRPCDMDRRIIYAELTAAGKERMSEILPNHYKTLAESFASLSPEEKEQAIGLLKKISFSLTQ